MLAQIYKMTSTKKRMSSRLGSHVKRFCASQPASQSKKKNTPNYDDKLRKIVENQMNDDASESAKSTIIRWNSSTMHYYYPLKLFTAHIHAVITHDLEHFMLFFFSFEKKTTELNRKVIILHEVFGDQEKFQTQNTNISCCDVCRE